MIYTSDSLDIKESLDSGHNVLEFTFKGHFTEMASKRGGEFWSQVFDEDPSRNFELIWDCTDMSGFDPKARKEWYNCIQSYKHRIDLVHVVSKSLIIRGAAKVMMEYFRIKSNMVRSYDEIFEAAAI